MTSKRAALTRMKRAARNGNNSRRNAARAEDDVATGNASVKQNFSTTCPVLVHSSASSIQTREAPSRGSQATFTTARMRNGGAASIFVAEQLSKVEFELLNDSKGFDHRGRLEAWVTSLQIDKQDETALEKFGSNHYERFLNTHRSNLIRTGNSNPSSIPSFTRSDNDTRQRLLLRKRSSQFKKPPIRR